MSLKYRPQTTLDTIHRIESGVDPWIAYRDFLEDWTYIAAARPELAAQEPVVSDVTHLRWVALLAATIDELARRDGLAVPQWTAAKKYRLAEPWYLYRGTGRIRQWLRESTPKSFSSRNIWSGDRLLRRT